MYRALRVFNEFIVFMFGLAIGLYLLQEVLVAVTSLVAECMNDMWKRITTSYYSCAYLFALTGARRLTALQVSDAKPNAVLQDTFTSFPSTY